MSATARPSAQARAYARIDELVAERDSLQREVARLRAAIEEHHAEVLMGARDEHDLNAADEALWEALSEPEAKAHE